MDIKNIGNNLKYFRRLKHLSQTELADKAGISLSYYRSLESKNSGSPSLETLIKICTVLNVPLDCLVKDAGIEIFRDYTNYLFVKDVQNMNVQEKKYLSHMLMSIHRILNETETTLA